MQGASAIDHLLKEMGDVPVRAYVVWEPVLATDWSTPGSPVLSRIADPRAAQYWDKDRLLSNISQPVLQKPTPVITGKESLITGEVVWDYVGVYPPGVRWEREFPTPVFKGAPVVDVLKELRAAIGDTVSPRASN